MEYGSEFRQKQEDIEKQVNLRCLKTDTGKMAVELMQAQTKTNELLKDLHHEYDKNRQRVEGRIEDMTDKGRGRTESIMKLQTSLDETNERIMQSRRNAANNSSRMAMKEEIATGPSVDKEFVDELDEEIKEMHQEIKDV